MRALSSIFGGKKKERTQSNNSSEDVDKYAEILSFEAQGKLFQLKAGKDPLNCLFISGIMKFSLPGNNNYFIEIENELYDEDQDNIERIPIEITKGLLVSRYQRKDYDDEDLEGFHCVTPACNHYIFDFMENEEADKAEFYLNQLLYEVKMQKSFESAAPKDLQFIKQKNFSDIITEFQTMSQRFQLQMSPPSHFNELPAATEQLQETPKSIELEKGNNNYFNGSDDEYYSPENSQEQPSSKFNIEEEKKHFLPSFGNKSTMEHLEQHPEDLFGGKAYSISSIEPHPFNQESKLENEPELEKDSDFGVEVKNTQTIFLKPQNILFKTTKGGKIYQYNEFRKLNEFLGSNSYLTFGVLEKTSSVFIFLITLDNGQLLEIKIFDLTNDLFYQPEDQVITFFSQGGFAYLYTFGEYEEKKGFMSKVVQINYEQGTKMLFSTIKEEDDVDWIQKGFENSVCQMEIDTNYNESQYFSLEDDEKEEEKETPKSQFSIYLEEHELENKETIQAYSKDRTFVLSGNNLFVYKVRPNEDYLSEETSIPVVNKYKSRPIQNPENGMLFDAENSMLFLDDNKDKIFRMDLNRGQVVEEYQMKDDVEVSQISGAFKNSQKVGAKEFIGLNAKNLYQFDSRLKDPLVKRKNYKTNYQFSCLKANLEGGIAVGSRNGEIRLYTQIGQNAKNLFPGFGERILGIDVTQDGKWVLATCEKFLILIPTSLQNTTGFKKNIRKPKPIPTRLALKVEDVLSYNLRSFNFTIAKFNNGDSSCCENSIISSIGAYAVIWDFIQIQKGFAYSYTIKKLKDSIITNEFTYNNDEKVLVTHPTSIKMKKRQYR